MGGGLGWSGDVVQVSNGLSLQGVVGGVTGIVTKPVEGKWT